MTDELTKRLTDFITSEFRSCSMDLGCVTPLYVYRMWGGSVELGEIENAMKRINAYDIKYNTI